MKKYDCVKSLYNAVGPQLGLYNGKLLEKFLFGLVAEQLPALANKERFTFQDFHYAGGLPLKIVVTDLEQRSEKIFSLDATPTDSVIHAVRASAGYPFVFRPPVQHDGSFLVDGGLASNFPVFLFNNGNRRPKEHVFAFNLVVRKTDGDNTAKEDYDMNRFVRDMLSTALEAGDHIIQQQVPGVEFIPVPVTAEVDALDFGISKSVRADLLTSGENATRRHLHNYFTLRKIEEAGEEEQHKLWAIYGPPYLYQPILAAIAREVEAHTQARDVRVSIMLPTGAEDGRRMVAYSHGMEGDDDRALSLPANAGCSGAAWVSDEGMASDGCRAPRPPQPQSDESRHAQHAARSQIHRQHRHPPLA